MKVSQSQLVFAEALAMALLCALGLSLAGAAAPWPPAAAVFVYGLRAWPAARHYVPGIPPMTYAAVWFALALSMAFLEAVSAVSAK